MGRFLDLDVVVERLPESRSEERLLTRGIGMVQFELLWL
jgi:hypothetical protein